MSRSRISNVVEELQLLKFNSQNLRVLDDRIATIVFPREPVGNPGDMKKLMFKVSLGVWEERSRLYTSSLDAAKTLYRRVPRKIPSDPIEACVEALQQITIEAV